MKKSIKKSKTKSEKLYLKVTQKGGKGLYHGQDQSRPIRFIEKSDLNDDETKECEKGIYFCEPHQLPLWWQPNDIETEIRVVKPLGKIIKISKGYRTDKLNHTRLLKEKELKEIENEYNFNWKERSQISGNDSTQTAGSNSTQIAGSNSTQKAESNSTQTAGSNSTQKAGSNSTQTAGSNSTQIAGWNSTQTAGSNSTQIAGSNSTQIIYGSISYIILDGTNVITRQIYFDVKKNQSICNLIDHNKILKKYKKGTKLEINEGKIKKFKK